MQRQRLELGPRGQVVYDDLREAIERGEDPDMLEVFEEALRECLQRENWNKDDLANVWAMLQLGSRAIRRFNLGTDRYDFGPSSNPPAIARNTR